MRCKHCNAQIETKDLYCPKCRKKTQNIKENFMAWTVFKESCAEVKEKNGFNFGFNLTFTIITFLFLAFLGTHFFIMKYPSEMLRYGVENLIFLLFVPLLLVPFGIQNEIMEMGYNKDLTKYIIKQLPKYYLFVLVNIVIFALYKFLCIGDPVLRLVRVILVLWWLAVLVPMPVMLTKYKHNLYRLFRLSLKGYEDLRWQMFASVIFIFIFNVVMIIPLFLGYLRYGNLPYVAINKYVDKVEKHGVISI